MKISHKPLLSMFGSLALVAAVSGVAVAQSSMPAKDANGMDKMGAMHSGHDSMKGMKCMHGPMMGMHMMPATVTEVDTHTGMVEANAEGMALKVHFPPASVATLKAGDKITLHMGYSKP